MQTVTKRKNMKKDLSRVFLLMDDNIMNIINLSGPPGTDAYITGFLNCVWGGGTIDKFPPMNAASALRSP